MKKPATGRSVIHIGYVDTLEVGCSDLSTEPLSPAGGNGGGRADSVPPSPEGYGLGHGIVCVGQTPIGSVMVGNTSRERTAVGRTIFIKPPGTVPYGEAANQGMAPSRRIRIGTITKGLAELEAVPVALSPLAVPSGNAILIIIADRGPVVPPVVGVAHRDAAIEDILPPRGDGIAIAGIPCGLDVRIVAGGAVEEFHPIHLLGVESGSVVVVQINVVEFTVGQIFAINAVGVFGGIAVSDLQIPEDEPGFVQQADEISPPVAAGAVDNRPFAGIGADFHGMLPSSERVPIDDHGRIIDAPAQIDGVPGTGVGHAVLDVLPRGGDGAGAAVGACR